MTLMMSVSGVRGIVGETMTPRLAADLGAAYGTRLKGGMVVLARDSRISGAMLENAVSAGLQAAGCRVIRLGIVSTPAAGLMIGELKAAGGIVITASHNPIPWNGIKFLTERGFAPTPPEAKAIFDIYHDSAFKLRGAEEVGAGEFNERAIEIHVNKALGVIDGNAIRRRKFKVVLDSVNGAGGEEGRQLLQGLGCDIVHLNAEANGRFAHTPEPTRENLTELSEAVAREGADIGFAQDPDADRLAIVDEAGTYIGEEYTLALCSRHLLAQQAGPIAANLSTSRMVDDIAAEFGGAARVIRTAVGEANVSDAMMREQAVFGGEGNGGVIDPRIVYVRNSIAGMGIALDLLAADGGPLSGIVDRIPAYTMVKEKIEMDLAAVPAWLEKIKTETDGRVLDQDGVRVDWDDGWVHVRPSNTEPIARVISEAKDEATARELAERVMKMR